MSEKALGILTQRLSPNGHQRLCEFLDVTDTAAAARFRSWLSTAAESEISSAAELLNRASHGTQFVPWWKSRDRLSSAPQPAATPHSRTPLEHLHSQARARSANADL